MATIMNNSRGLFQSMPAGTKMIFARQERTVLESFVSCFRLHLKGEQSLLQVFGSYILLVFSPVSGGWIISVLMETYFPGTAMGTSLFFGNFGFLLTMLGALWWCAGLHSMCLRSLETGRFVRAVALILIAAQAGWWVLTDWAPFYVRSTREDWSNSWHPQGPAMEDWQGIPLKVIPSPELHRFVVYGEVGLGSAAALSAAISANPAIHLIEIESEGGFVWEADQITALIEMGGLDTLVRGKCYSACTEIFLAGRSRYVGPKARFGFHQSGYSGRPHNTVWDIPEYSSSIYYREKGVDAHFAEQALNTSYYELWRPDVYDVKMSGFATRWWADRPAGY